MNSRQRRGVILLVVSALCAVAAFAGVVAVLSDARSQVGPKVTAYLLTKDIPAYQPVTAGQLQKVSTPERWLPRTAVRSLAQLNNKVAATPLTRGSLLQSDMITARPALQPGQMEIAIMIDAATGVAGKITPGARVNIFATFAPLKTGDPEVSKIIVANARVIDVGTIHAFDQSQSSPGAATQGVPITFALGAEDAQRVAYAESFARHVRLALVAPGDASGIPPAARSYTLAGDNGVTR
jgi:pilus assembly protein CpaB